jgi:S1-C subfamily serine protease
MSADADLIAAAERMLDDLQRVRDAFLADPDRTQELVTAPVPADVDPKAVVGPIAGPGADRDATLRALLTSGAAAVEGLARGEALDGDQQQGLGALLHLAARPALFLEDTTFTDAAEPWGQALIDAAAPIVETGHRVGRVETGGPVYAGSGFLVGDGVLMTNCHVAMKIADPAERWALRGNVTPTVRFAPDPTAPGTAVAVERVIGVHERLDLALLRIAGDGLPAPLELAATAPEPVVGHNVYVVGYPARTQRAQEARIAQLVFGDRYGVKRLQPGALLPSDLGPPLIEAPCSQRTVVADVVHHDASTLGGNSGSCVVDLATHRVLGLHFAGAHLRYNDAVALWNLTDDPLLTRAGVRFARG